VACREVAPKTSLVRVVRTAEGARVDLSGMAPGRGAYVHRDDVCIERAIARGALARALRVGLAEGELGRLRGLIEGDV
jgi:predicted RNA-binding protein YlxR (DUF448 family)